MLAGSLIEFGLADVFSLLSATRKTGSLNLQGAGVHGRVWIAGGGLCFAQADTTRAPLAARLLHAGDITAEQVPALVEAHGSDDPSAIHDCLTGLGLPSERVRSLLLDQVVDAVFDLSRWGEGTFGFDQHGDSDSIPVATAADVLAQVEARMGEWTSISQRVPAAQQVLALAGSPQPGAQAISIDAAHWPFLTVVDGLRTTHQVIEVTGQGVFTGSRILADLVGAGLVEVRQDPTPESAAAHRARVVAEAENRLLGAPEATPAPAVPPAPAPAPAAAPTSQADDSRPAEASEQATDQAQASTDPTPSAAELLDEVGHAATPHVDPDHAPEADVVDPSGDTPIEETAEDPAEPWAPQDAEPAATPAEPSAEEARRARELAALGLGPAPAAGPATDEPAEEQPLRRDSQVNADLLARLIDGVKGA